MTYRDDVDTLYTRAMILQKELDRANRQLAESDAELTRLRGPSFAAAETSPGMRQLRSLPDPDAVLARLVDAGDATPAPAVRALPPLPEHVRPSEPPMTRGKVLERLRDRLGALEDEALVVIGTIIEELGDEAPLDKSELLERLRPLADRITQSFWRRR